MGEGSSERGALQPLADEFLARWRRGENPTISDFCAEYPDQAAALKGLLVTIQMLEGGPATDDVASCREHRFDLDEIGGYRIIGEIGRGGMGVVYEAEHTTLARRVAIKVLPHHASQSKSAQLRFEREARAAAGMHHTNIVPVFEVGHENEYFFYAMQLIRGQSLDKLINELKRASSGSKADQLRAAKSDSVSTATDPSSTSPTAEMLASKLDASSTGSNRLRFYRSIARIGIQVAEAMDYAHGRGIIHRDIKPSNLIQDESGVVWLTDFGLAKTDDDGMTQTGEYLGTLRYMSPERFKGDCDARSDIYALGLTLYELLLQRPAFEASDRLLLIHSINEASPVSPRSIDSRIPRDLETIILKSIDKDPGSRYASAKALAEDLRRFVADQPIKARRHSLAERFLRWSRRNQSLAASLLTIGALLVIGVIGLAFSLSNEARLRGQAEASHQAAEQRGVQLQKTAVQLRQTSDELQQSLYFSQMKLAGKALSEGIAGNTLATQLAKWQPVKGGRDLRGWEWYYLRARSRQAVFSSPGLYKEAFRWCWCVDYSPDGTELVNAVNGWGIQIRDSSGKVLREKFLGSARSVDWSPDDTNIAVAGFGSPGSVIICDALTLEATVEIECPDHHEVECVRWSPDSSRIAVCGDGKFRQQHSVRIHRAETGELEQSFEHPHRVRGVDWSPNGSRIATVPDDLLVRTWNVTTGEMLAEISCNEGALKIRWSPDGKKLAVVGGTVQCWNVMSREELEPADVAAVNIGARSVAWHPLKDQLAVGCQDGSVRVLDGNTLRIIRLLDGHHTEVWSVVWRTGGTRLASAELFEGKLHFWDIDLQDQNQILHPRVHDKVDAVFLEWTSDGSSLVSTNDIWNLTTGDHQELDDPEAIDGRRAPTTVAISPDARRLAFGGKADFHQKQTIHTRDSSGEATPMSGLVDWTTAMAWSADGQFAVLSDVGDVVVWNTDGKRVLEKKKLHEGRGFYLRWAPDARRVATIGSDNYVKVWDAATWELIWEERNDTHRVYRVCWSRDGSQLATSQDGALMIWDAATGQHLATMDEIQERFRAMDWSPDGSRLAVCSTDSLTIWHVGLQQVALRLVPGGESVRWSPDGRRLAVGSVKTGTIRILDASTGYE